jgi:alpha-glucoside transport system substrate-binding protein
VETGIEIQIEPTGEDYSAQLEREPPDIAVVSAPSFVADLSRAMDLGAYLDVEQLRTDFSPSVLSMGTVAADGSWPSEGGTLYGVPVHFNLKSLIWYPVPEFRQAGYEIPETWDELVQLTDQMVDDGRTPWCMGLESGFASGWPATDWVENLLLAGAGQRVYDDWTSHRIPFDHPAVRRAFERFGQIVFGEGNLSVGTQGALVTAFEGAQIPMVQAEPPGCWLYHFPSFASFPLPRGSVGTTTDAFPFPSPNPRHPDTLLVGGGMAVALADRPEVREVMRLLVHPEFGRDWFTSEGGAFSANRRFDMSAYAPTWRRQAEVLHAALDAGTFRFDGSDLMPPEVGFEAFWNAMIRYVSEGPESLDAVLADLDAAWPDDG